MARINYLDNLKGFSILSVVIGHLYLIYNSDSIIYSFIQCYQMPIFIFISGFLSYKDKNRKSFFFSVVKNRTKSILIPYISFCFIYVFVNGIESAYPFFCGFTRGGLWFLPTIYTLNIIGYLILSYNSSLIVSTLFVIVVELFFVILRNVLPVDISDLFLIRHISTYWMIYAMGYLFNKYKMQVSDKIEANVTILFVALWGATELYLESNEIFRMILRCLSCLSFFCFFSKINSGIINKIFGMLGRESLCIYVIHYLFLMLCDPCKVEVFLEPDLLQFIYFLFLSFVISYMCILVKKILSKNSFFKMYLFGEKV